MIPIHLSSDSPPSEKIIIDKLLYLITHFLGPIKCPFGNGKNLYFFFMYSFIRVSSEFLAFGEIESICLFIGHFSFHVSDIAIFTPFPWWSLGSNLWYIRFQYLPKRRWKCKSSPMHF
jgi:hypothetical protein